MNYTAPAIGQAPAEINPFKQWDVDFTTYAGASGPSSAAWPAANLAIYVPIYVEQPTLVMQLRWLNGGTVTGSTTLDAAVYNEDGTQRLIHGGGVTQSGTNVYQAFNVTDTLLLPGRYWFGMVLSNNTSTISRWTSTGTTQNIQKFLGLQEEALGSAAMPSATTFAANTRVYVPVVGVVNVSNTL